MAWFPQNGGNDNDTQWQTQFHDSVPSLTPFSTFQENNNAWGNVNGLWVNEATHVPPMPTPQVLNQHYRHPLLQHYQPLLPHMTHNQHYPSFQLSRHNGQVELSNNLKNSLAQNGGLLTPDHKRQKGIVSSLTHRWVDPTDQAELSNDSENSLAQNSGLSIQDHQHQKRVVSGLTHYWIDSSSQVQLPNNSKNSLVKNGGSSAPSRQRKKRVPWTEKEHKLFLIGLTKYGKGKWKEISTNLVQTKTLIQVASHVQKYFISQGTPPEKKKRKSIHNIILQDTDLVAYIDQQNYIPAPDFSMQQLQEIHQAQNMPHLNPPNNMANQMGGSVYFDNNS